MRVRRVESLSERLRVTQQRGRGNLEVIQRILRRQQLTEMERGRLLGACVCLMEEVRLVRELVRI